jgi:SAM-dependent methyltransferase
MNALVTHPVDQHQQLLDDWVPLPRYLLRTRIVKPLIARLAPRDFVEIGAASGEMARWLGRRGVPGIAVEISKAAMPLLRARLRDVGNVRIFEQDSRSLDTSTDLLLSMEVLEHIEDDRAALTDWHRLVRPGGHIVISVPAHQRRFSEEDVMAGHFRRYEKHGLRDLLIETGFETPDVYNYGFPLSPLLKQLRDLAARRRLATDGRDRQERTEASGVDRAKWKRWKHLLNERVIAPFHWMQAPFLRFDFGDGLLAVARKPESAP